MVPSLVCVHISLHALAGCMPIIPDLLTVIAQVSVSHTSPGLGCDWFPDDGIIVHGYATRCT